MEFRHDTLLAAHGRLEVLGNEGMKGTKNLEVPVNEGMEGTKNKCAVCRLVNRICRPGLLVSRSCWTVEQPM